MKEYYQDIKRCLMDEEQHKDKEYGKEIIFIKHGSCLGGDTDDSGIVITGRCGTPGSRSKKHLRRRN